jgi:hypothetical protein
MGNGVFIRKVEIGLSETRPDPVASLEFPRLLWWASYLWEQLEFSG